MEKVKLGIFLLVCLLGQHEALAFTCYKCNSNANEQCIENPKELGFTVDCDDFCTIIRTEYTDIPGEVVTLVRDCEAKPIVENGVRTDKHYTKMYTSCNSDQCNSGDGKRAPGEGNEGRTGPKDVIIVYESDSGFMNKPSYIFILGTVFLYLLL